MTASARAPRAEPSPELATARIESLNHDGQGVARIDGKVVFIDGALPGETVRARIRRRHRRHDTADLIEIVSASPGRVTPRCPHFGVCGGCSLQHLAAAEQIREKQMILAGQLAHLGQVEPGTWLAPLAGPPFGYRRRARLGVRHVAKKGGVLVGFREKRSSYIAPLAECHTLLPEAARLLPGLKTLIASLSCSSRLPQVEVAAGDNALALVFRHLVELTAGDREALAAFGRQHDVQIWLQGGRPDDLVALWPAQPVLLRYTLAEQGVRFEFGPTDFVQVNAAINAQMVAQALRLLDPGPRDRVLDLFCGLGNFTLPLARRAGRVLGLEADAAALARARHNAVINDIHNAEFRTANLRDGSSPELPWGDFACDKLLLDPPRTGAIEVIRRLSGPVPGRIVYVSCNPATLARDSHYLVHALGYRLAAAGVLDMFPQTSHVESMTLFTR
jgi:23S rRNA (uracil1939-C5)-methyltransferase